MATDAPYNRKVSRVTRGIPPLGGGKWQVISRGVPLTKNRLPPATSKTYPYPRFLVWGRKSLIFRVYMAPSYRKTH